MKTRYYKVHYLSYEEGEILKKFDKGPTVTEEIQKIISCPHDDKKTERSVPPMREKKKITFD